MADAWPNYVKLGNGTCWRIVRTTGSGGVKMIYNGLYGVTTAGSCTNVTDNAQTAKKTFNYVGTGSNGIVAVGYTFNDTYLATAENTMYSTLFG